MNVGLGTVIVVVTDSYANGPVLLGKFGGLSVPSMESVKSIIGIGVSMPGAGGVGLGTVGVT